MSVESMIPTLWSAELLDALDKSLVAKALTNQDYEGDIRSHGDAVRINTLSRVTISDYTKNSTEIVPEQLETAAQTLEITQSKMFSFLLDDVDRAQTMNDGAIMSSAMRDAAYGLADGADTYILSTIKNGVQSANALTAAAGAAFSIGTAAADVNAYVKLVDLGVTLDDENVPRQGRWVVVTPWFRGMLMKDDRFVNYGTSQNRADLSSGLVGAAAGFDIHVSSNLPDGAAAGSSYILAGANIATTFASQINDVESFRPEAKFADAVKGLYLYGCSVTRPQAVSSAYVVAA